MDGFRGAYKRHIGVPEERREQSVSDYEKACLIRGDGGRAIRGILDRIGDKWSLLVIATLDGGRMRFGDLKRHVPGVSQRMLTLTLRHLERDGLVARTSYPEVPPRVEYELTDMGRTLVGPAVSLAEWAIRHNPLIDQQRRDYDARLD